MEEMEVGEGVIDVGEAEEADEDKTEAEGRVLGGGGGYWHWKLQGS